jgi:acyl-homoserine lactone acylase PvdQ
LLRRFVLTAAFALALTSSTAAFAQAPTEYAGTALNIIPSGQYGALGNPPGFDTQAKMYDGLTPLFDNVTPADLTTYYKSEKFGVDTATPSTVETVPRPGVTIVRDSYNVPHVTGVTHDDGVWAAGWIAAEDRGLLLGQARFNSRVAAIGAPGLDALNLISSLKSFVPSQQTEDEVAKQSDVLTAAGPEGVAVLHDIDVFISGINEYLALNSPSTVPFTRNDIFALNALKGQFVGQGGGNESANSEFLAGLQKRYGAKKGMSVFNDLRQFKNPELSTSVDGKFPYGAIPTKAKGSVILDPHSFVATPAVADAKLAREAAPSPQPRQASNTLMISANHSETGKPLMVGGPQIGYFYPGLTYEIDMHAGDLQWRGATSAPFPGYQLIGRGEDFADTLTSASGDIIDQYVETLCGGSDTKYEYKGKCLDMTNFDAGTLNGQPVSFKTTVHGPVIGYATVKGKKVAISSKRSTYGKDTLDLLYNRRLSNGQVHSAKSFMQAAALTPQTFNSFYIDDKNIAMYTAGLLPLRPKSLDPGLPTDGRGKYEWTGFLSTKGHPQGIDPADGTITNWNQTTALGFGSADNTWGHAGSVERVDLLNKNLDRLADKKGKWSLPSLTSAMNAAATQDVRAIDTVPLLNKLLKGSKAPNAQAQQMLKLMVAWNKHGGSRLDLDLDGNIDDPGAAVMDGSWDNIADAFMAPVLNSAERDELNDGLMSRFDAPPGGQYDGWYQYFDRDIRTLLGIKNKAPFENAYCGAGKLKSCQKAIWKAIAKSGQEIATAQGSSDPSQWHSDANAERIKFVPGLIATTMRYANRPSGIQQVISFDGHR